MKFLLPYLPVRDHSTWDMTHFLKLIILLHQQKKGTSLTKGTAGKRYHIPAFTTHRRITSNFEVIPSGMSEDSYKVIMGRDIITGLGLIIDFKNGRLLWDELELSLNTKATTSNESYEQTRSVVTSVESRVVRNLDLTPVGVARVKTSNKA
jgi:hypothetical protein